MIVLDGAVKRRPTLVVLSEDSDGLDELNARGQSGVFSSLLLNAGSLFGVQYTSTLETIECM